MAHESLDENIVYTAALFQSGYFLPKQPEYARFLLTEVFSKYAQSSLDQVFADSLSLAILGSRHLPIARALLDLGADPNRPSHEGVSPLTEALLCTNIDGVRLLLARGANFEQDRALESPFDILSDHYDREEDKEVFEMIEKAAKRGEDAK